LSFLSQNPSFAHDLRYHGSTGETDQNLQELLYTKKTSLQHRLRHCRWTVHHIPEKKPDLLADSQAMVIVIKQLSPHIS
jgi:hypothetical protein